jgi:hypothetical protein
MKKLRPVCNKPRFLVLKRVSSINEKNLERYPGTMGSKLFGNIYFTYILYIVKYVLNFNRLPRSFL